MGENFVSGKAVLNIMIYIWIDYGESVSNICAVVATNVNLGYFPLGSFSANW